MKPIFTIHEGEFLVGDHITRKFDRKYSVWIPGKDEGIDLLVTRKPERPGDAMGVPVGLQIKYSRGYDNAKQYGEHVLATSWFVLNPDKIRLSTADYWVFVLINRRHDKHFVVVPTAELRRRIPKRIKGKWTLYLWVFAHGGCYEVRGLKNDAKTALLDAPPEDDKLDFTQWLNNWDGVCEGIDD